jgi:hypothetical protein
MSRQVIPKDGEIDYESGVHRFSEGIAIQIPIYLR